VRAKDLGALVLLAAIWGSSYLFIRVAVAPLGPLVVAFLRVFIAGLGLLAFATFRRRRAEIPGISKPFLILGLLNSAVPYGLIALAELHLTASMAGILNATTPLFTAVVVAMWSKERLAAKTILGLVMGFAGVAVLVGWNPAPFDGWLALSVAAMLLASLSYGVASAYAKRALSGISSLGAAAGQQISAAVILVPFGLATASMGKSDTSPSIRVALAMLALGLLCTSVAYLLYFHLIASVGAVNTISVTFLIPIFGIAWSALFLGEAVRPAMAVGLAVILASVVLVTGVRIPRVTRPDRKQPVASGLAEDLVEPSR
jgi:drug/metabolite transporter (DMT)-like permease